MGIHSIYRNTEKSCSYSSGSEKSLSPFKVWGNYALLERSLTPVNGASGCPIPKVGREATKKNNKKIFFSKEDSPLTKLMAQFSVSIEIEHWLKWLICQNVLKKDFFWQGTSLTRKNFERHLVAMQFYLRKK